MGFLAPYKRRFKNSIKTEPFTFVSVTIKRREPLPLTAEIIFSLNLDDVRDKTGVCHLSLQEFYPIDNLNEDHSHHQKIFRLPTAFASFLIAG